MNFAILQTDVQQFITEHLNKDITKILLKGSPFKNISGQELVNQIITKQKSQDKIPTWFATKNIYFPAKISIEQSSSEITANYKNRIIKGSSIVDITGGFGVDCFAFSKSFQKVFHCEINAELSTIVKHNYQQLKIENITTISGNGIDFLKSSNQNFDCLYIDPSRRSNTKGKVFLLVDCLPNVPESLDFLCTKAKQILVKCSPILDISSALKELRYVKEIHVVAKENEVKELLFLIEEGYVDSIKINTINILKTREQTFDFMYNSVCKSTYSLPKTYLYEPNSAVLKSGAFHQVSHKFNLAKLHQHSHLYTSEILKKFPGRVFKIDAVMFYNKKKLGNLLKDNKANITVRNFPKTVAVIRKETKIKAGGDVFLFFTKNIDNKYIVIFCSKI